MNHHTFLVIVGAIYLGGPLLAAQSAVKPTQVIETNCKRTTIIGVSPNGNRIFCFDYWTLTQIDLASPKRDKTLPLPPPFRGTRIYTAAHVKDQLWLLAVARASSKDADQEDNRLILFDFATNTVKADWAAHAECDANLIIAPKQNLILENTTHGYQIWFWDLKTGKKVAKLDLLRELRLKEPAKNEKDMKRWVLDPSSSFLAVGLDGGMVKVWNIKNKKWHDVVPVRKGSMLSALAFVGRHTLAGVWCDAATSNEYLEVYDWKVGKLLFRAGAPGSFATLAVSPNERLLAVGGQDVNQSQGWIRLWDVVAQRDIGAFKVSDCYLGEMTFTKTGKQLITCDADGRIKVWDVERIVKQLKP